MATKLKPKQRQAEGFKKIARILECDESEATFDKALGKIGRSSQKIISSSKSKAGKIDHK